MSFPINRLISKRITPILAAAGLSPNTVTLLSLGAGFMAAWNVGTGLPDRWVMGALWLELAYLLDNCDGELARMTGRFSPIGSWLDTIVDCVIHTAFFFSLGWGMYRYFSQPFLLEVAWAAAMSVFITYIAYVLEQVQLRGREAWRHPDPPFEQRLGTAAGRLRSALREDFALIIVVMALLNQMIFLLMGSLLGFLCAGLGGFCAMAVRWSRHSPVHH